MYVNIDMNSRNTPFWTDVVKRENVTVEAVEEFLDFYDCDNVTDILFCIFEQSSATDSNVWSTYADKYLQKEENGVPVDYTKEFEGLYKLNKEYGIDPYKVWIEGSRSRGKNPWISIRMNDCHLPDEPSTFLRSDFFYTAEKNGWFIGDKYGYYRKNYNYAIPEVRQKMLDYIDEQLNRYDVFGVELDFLREILCFDFIKEDNEKIVKIMNDFICRVSTIVKSAEEKHGHEIKIAIRLPRDIDHSRVFGFDARTWAKEKWVDMIIPSPRFEHSDSMIPIKIWQEEAPVVKIIPGIEMLAACGHGGLSFMTADMVRGIAGGFYSDGADDIYLYNFFGEYMPEESLEIYRTCQSAEEIAKHPTRYPVLGQESATSPAHKDPTSEMKPFSPLPATIDCEGWEIEINTVKITKDKEVSLVFGIIDGSVEGLYINANGTEYTKFDAIDTPGPEYLMEADAKCFRCFIKPSGNTKQRLEFKMDSGKAVINWIELDVR